MKVKTSHSLGNMFANIMAPLKWPVTCKKAEKGEEDTALAEVDRLNCPLESSGSFDIQGGACGHGKAFANGQLKVGSSVYQLGCRPATAKAHHAAELVIMSLKQSISHDHKPHPVAGAMRRMRSSSRC